MDPTVAENQPKLPFKQRVSFEERKAFAIQLRQKKPHYVPLVVENDGTSNAIDLKKDRFFIPEDSKVSDFVKVLVDKYIECDGETPISTVSVKIQTPSKAVQPSNEDTIGSLYAMYQEEDGYLYFIVYRESVFGN
ncbi:Autophagy-related protein [Entamoeba marina]